MRSRPALLVVVGALLTAGAATGLGSTPTAVAGPAPTPRTRVLADVIPRLSELRDLGELAPNRVMSVGVSLPGDIAGLDTELAATQRADSPEFGKTFTPAAIGARWGISRAVSRAALTALEVDGLRPGYVARDGEYALLRGTAGQVERTFHTSLHGFSARGRTWFANTVGATVPGAVSAVVGLTDLTDVRVADSQNLCDGFGAAPTGDCMGTTLFPALWGSYDMPNNGLTGNLGQGQKIAIFGDGDVNTPVEDLRRFERQTSIEGVDKPVLPQVPVREVLVDDPQLPTTDTSGTSEFDLDTQSSSGVSPGLAELDLYFGPDLSDQTIGAIYSTWVNDDAGPAIGSSSFGGCEPLEHASGGEQTTDVLLAKAALEGRTMFVSTGDNGSGGCILVANAGQPGAPGISSPASSPDVVAVGGTVLYTTSDGGGSQAVPTTRADEYGWTGTGGGYSDFESEPAGQARLGGVLPARMPCPEAGSGDGTCRTVPDIASLSGDDTGDSYAIVSKGADSVVLGTSLSSPSAAGAWARVRAAHKPVAGGCVTSGLPDAGKADLGFALTDLYDVATSSTANDASGFFDVGGLMKSMPSSNQLYTTLPRDTTTDPTGYDLLSGLGVMDVGNLARLLDCGTATVIPSLPAASVPRLTVVDADTFANGAGASCPPNGVATDAVGDALPANDPALDIAGAKISYDATGVTFTVRVSGAPLAPAEDDGFVVFFDYGGTVYGVDVDTLGGPGYGETGAVPVPGSPAYRLLELQTTRTPDTPVMGSVSVYETPTYLGDLTGRTDSAGGSYSITMPYATFNAEAAALTRTAVTPGGPQPAPLGLGGTLAGAEALSGIEPGFGAPAAEVVADTLEFDCPIYLGAAALSTGTVVTTQVVAPPKVTPPGTAVKPTVKKPAAARGKATARPRPARPRRTLAFTGGTALLPGSGLLLLGGLGALGVGARVRRRSER